MPVILKCTWSTAMTSDLVFSGGGRRRTLTVVRRKGMRTMRLTIDPRNADVRLTLPPRAPLRPAIAWASEKRAWIEAELARMPPPQPIVPGIAFLLAGEPVVLEWAVHHPRSPSLGMGATGERVLMVGGSRESLSPRVLRYLKKAALDRLGAETGELAAAHGITVARVGIGDPRARWGSCSANGDIRYSWRLILAPDHVRRATVAHEVAHRLHMDHSRAFHACAARLLGSDPAPARAWLRTQGALLHGFGREG